MTLSSLRKSLASIPRIPLGNYPTPFEPLPRLGRELGGMDLWIKRDDLTGLALGGNKTRMLEFSLAVALDRGADTIVTGAAVQSNYCRQMAAACAKLGLHLRLILRPIRPKDKKEIQGNNLLQRLFGAEVSVLENEDMAAQDKAIQEEAQRLRGQGRKVYVPREPDTIDLDALAYLESGLETIQQFRDKGLKPQALYCASWDTTQAGMEAAKLLAGENYEIRGFCPFENQPNRFAVIQDLAQRAAQRLGAQVTLRQEDILNEDGLVGPRYGLPTEAGLEAVKLMASTEGILLDPVYTGKAMSGLIRDARLGRIEKGQTILFLHTGGSPALFGYAEDLGLG